MIPFWLWCVAGLAGAGLIGGAAGYCLGSAERRVDRILAGELRRPVVNPQEEADRAERERS